LELYVILIYALFCSTASMMYQYFVKIVPTIYVKGDGEVRELSYTNKCSPLYRE